MPSSPAPAGGRAPDCPWGANGHSKCPNVATASGLAWSPAATPRAPSEHRLAAATPSTPVPAKRPLSQRWLGLVLGKVVKQLASAGRRGPGGGREGRPAFEARGPPIRSCQREKQGSAGQKLREANNPRGPLQAPGHRASVTQT